MQILNIVGDIDEDMIYCFTEDYNKLKLDQPVTIYLNTGGGDTSIGDAIIDIINTSPFDITLVAAGYIYSAGFDIFFSSNCKKRILPGTLGMIHFSYAMVDINENGQTSTPHAKFLISEMKNSKANTVERLRELGLTPTELKKVNSNADCFFTTQRLNELLDGQKNRREEFNTL